MSDLDDIMRQLERLPPEDRARLEAEVMAATSSLRFIPNPGKQTMAMLSPADIILYGGSAGGGKSALGVGLAFNDHRRSLLLRRKYADLSGIIDQALVYNGGRDGFSSAPQPKLITSNGQLIKFGACQHLGDEEAFQGQAHDYYYFDELTQFLEQQFRYVIGWNRAGPGVDGNQRCRVLGGSNPPTNSDGDWVIGYWRPWLDPTYHNPAKPGELRWCVTDPDGKDMWVDGPELVDFNNGKPPVKPKSRTFIQAALSDNHCVDV